MTLTLKDKLTIINSLTTTLTRQHQSLEKLHYEFVEYYDKPSTLKDIKDALNNWCPTIRKYFNVYEKICIDAKIPIGNWLSPGQIEDLNKWTTKPYYVELI